MQEWISHFAAFFSGQVDRYVVIGGTAATVLMEQAGLVFRATKDIDLVLMPAGDAQFLRHIVRYIEAGGYKVHEKADGKKSYYRFRDPTDLAFPAQLEIFATKDDSLELGTNQYIVPVKDQSSIGLSAILLEDDYYNLIASRNTIRADLSIVDVECILVLKARAYIDMTERKSQGDHVDDADIKKHRNDIFMMTPLIPLNSLCPLQGLCKIHMRRFVDDMAKLPTVQSKRLLGNARWRGTLAAWVDLFEQTYMLR